MPSLVILSQVSKQPQYPPQPSHYIQRPQKPPLIPNSTNPTNGGPSHGTLSLELISCIQSTNFTIQIPPLVREQELTQWMFLLKKLTSLRASIVSKPSIRAMHIEAIPMRWGHGDNYCYLLIDSPSKNAWIIDPAEPNDVRKYLRGIDFRFELKAIVNTHHHYDHAGGNEQFHRDYPDLPIIAGKDSPLVSYNPTHNEVIDLGENLSITALHTPCHTQDSICYFVEDSKTGERAVFTGDTLFISGCGRFFEGDGKQMNKALNAILGKLPKDTKVYPGHEYTKSNVKFSKTVLHNEAISSLEKFAAENEYTTGKFTIGDELKFNPFMRLTDPQVVAATGHTDENEVMDTLRELKNKF